MKSIVENAQEQLEKNKKKINEIFYGDFSFSVQEGKITYLHIHDTTEVKENRKKQKKALLKIK